MQSQNFASAHTRQQLNGGGVHELIERLCNVSDLIKDDKHVLFDCCIKD